MLKQVKELRDKKTAGKYLERVHEWFKKQKAASKIVKSVNDPLDFDSLVDNVDLLKNLTAQLQDFKIS